MKETLITLGVGFTVLFTIFYFVILYFFPEWVGISGKDSEETLEAHKEEGFKDS
ncbi:MAG: hypothetical protein HRT44_07985 [Bdellovibrionales bacterium]|nr:hypothetical protein [Bdellovibrionales bacterium]NQZ19178.1 hypothetical protein [Bdellovibrionales bacterium]